VKLLFKTRVLGIPATLSSSVAGSFSAGPPLAHIDPAALAALYTGVLMAHLSVDAFDDYFDFKKGLAQLKARASDADAEVAEVITSHTISPRPLLALGASTMAAGLLAALYLAILRGPLVLVLALAGSIMIVAYTGALNKHGYLAEPLLVFKGLLVFLGSQLVAYGEIYPSTAPLGALFGAVSALVAYTHHVTHRDVDASLGRVTLPIVFERLGGPHIGYAALAATVYTLLVVSVLSGSAPPYSLALLAPSTVHIWIASRVWGKGYRAFSGVVVDTALACRAVDVGMASALVIHQLLPPPGQAI